MGKHELEMLFEQYIEQLWHQQNPDAVDDFLTPDYRRHLGAKGQPLSREGQKDLLRTFQSAFPDARITIDDFLIDGDLVALRSTFRATHHGVFRDIPPTGRQVTVRLLIYSECRIRASPSNGEGLISSTCWFSSGPNSQHIMMNSRLSAWVRTLTPSRSASTSSGSKSFREKQILRPATRFLWAGISKQFRAGTLSPLAVRLVFADLFE